MTNQAVTNTALDEVVYIAGELPDGTYGIVIDMERPFTDSELSNANLFVSHVVDLDKRIEEATNGR